MMRCDVCIREAPIRKQPLATANKNQSWRLVCLLNILINEILRHRNRQEKICLRVFIEYVYIGT